MNWNTAFDWLIHPHHNDDVADPYIILGIPRNSKNEEIKRAYRKLLMQNHPDKGGDQKRAQALNQAYNQIRRKRGI